MLGLNDPIRVDMPEKQPTNQHSIRHSKMSDTMLGLNDPKRVDMPENQPTNQPTNHFRMSDTTLADWSVGWFLMKYIKIEAVPFS